MKDCFYAWGCENKCNSNLFAINSKGSIGLILAFRDHFIYHRIHCGMVETPS